MLMTVALGLTLTMLPAIQRAPAVLPDTPQGRQVAAYIAAFNSGDEQAFLDAQERLFSKTALARRDRQERAALYRRMRGEFPKLVVNAVRRATPLTIQLAVPTGEGDEAEMTFDFEDTAPYRIVGIGVEIQARGGR